MDRDQYESLKSELFAQFPDDGMARAWGAIEALRKTACTLTDAEHCEDWVRIQIRLGDCFAANKTGELSDDLEAAIAHYRDALAVLKRPRLSILRAEAQLGLAKALLKRTSGDPADNKRQVIEALKSAGRIYRPSDHLISHVDCLVLQAKAHLLHPGSDKEKALSIYKRALTLVDPADYPEPCVVLHAKIAGVYQLRQKGSGRHNLRKSEEILKDALRACDTYGVSKKAFLYSHLAVTYHFQHYYLGEPTQDLAVEANKIALEGVNKETAPDSWTPTQANQAVYHDATKRRFPVAEIADDVFALIKDRLQQATTHSERRRLIGSIRGLSDRGTLALARDGSADAAFAFACRTRARFLRFLDDNSAKALLPPDSGKMYRDEIFVQFVPPVDQHAGMVFLVTHDGIETMDLDQLDSDALRRIKIKWFGGYLGSAENGSVSFARFQKALQATMALLGACLDPLLQHLQKTNYKKLVIAPSDLLALLPLHALELPDGMRRCLLDEFEVAYAVDLGTYLAKRDVPTRPDPRLLLVSDPERSFAHADRERQVLTDLLANNRVLCGEQADQPTVIDALGDDHDIIHFTCHGAYGWSYFDNGGLKLAGGDVLTFRSIIESVKLRPGAIVVLGACESGVTDYEEMPNETFGLQLAFLHAGARAVISTLWPVDDRATSLLMGSLYGGMANDLTPSKALRRAQLWLRNAANRELNGKSLSTSVNDQMRISNQDDGRNQDIAVNKDEKPYANPIFWAGFTVYGG